YVKLMADERGATRSQHKRRSNAEFVTEALLADSARRKALRLSRSDVSAQLLGDPLPGQSALDQRGAAETVKTDRRRVDGTRAPRLSRQRHDEREASLGRDGRVSVQDRARVFARLRHRESDAARARRTAVGGVLARARQDRM